MFFSKKRKVYLWKLQVEYYDPVEFENPDLNKSCNGCIYLDDRNEEFPSKYFCISDFKKKINESGWCINFTSKEIHKKRCLEKRNQHMKKSEKRC